MPSGLRRYTMSSNLRGLSRAVEILFEGADLGTEPTIRLMHFVRSLPVAKALHPDTLLPFVARMENFSITPSAAPRLPCRLAGTAWLR